MEHSKIISSFIEEIWNHRNFNRLNDFLHPEFIDYSLPNSLSPDKEGLKNWIVATGESFEHMTFIEDHITEGKKCGLRIKMNLKHIGMWRDMEATGVEVSVEGFRFFEIREDKIVSHWALIDGQKIENNLKKMSSSCKIGS